MLVVVFKCWLCCFVCSGRLVIDVCTCSVLMLVMLLLLLLVMLLFFYDRLVIDGCISILMLVMMLLLLCKWQTSYRCRCYDVDNVVVVGDGYIVLVVGCVVMLVTDLL